VKSPVPATSGEDGSSEEQNASGEKDTALAVEKPQSPKISSCDEDKESSVLEAPLSHDKEKLSSPQAVPEESSQHHEEPKESCSREELRVAEDSEKLEASKKEAPEESVAPSPRKEPEVEEDSSELAPSQEKDSLLASEPDAGSEIPSKEASVEEPLASVVENEENKSSQVGQIKNKKEEKEGIRPESRNEIVETEQNDTVSTKSTSEILDGGDDDSTGLHSVSSNKDLLSEANVEDEEISQNEKEGKANSETEDAEKEDGTKIQTDDADKVSEGESHTEEACGSEDVLASARKSPVEQESSEDPIEGTTKETPQEASAEEPMDVSEDPDKRHPNKKESNSILVAMARADIDNDENDDAMDVSSQDESDPLSSAAEKDVEMSDDHSEDKNKGCEVEIHTDIVKSEAYQNEESPSDQSKSNGMSEKEKEPRQESPSAAPDKTSEKEADQNSDETSDPGREDVTDQSSADKTSEEATEKSDGDREKNPAQVASAKGGDDDVCIIPDTVPQMMRKKLKEITEKSSPEKPSSDKTTPTATTDILEDSDEIVALKDSSRGKKKSTAPPVEVEFTRPQRQAAKKAESQIKVRFNF